jgi:arylsulfatase A-like enzyme
MRSAPEALRDSLRRWTVAVAAALALLLGALPLAAQPTSEAAGPLSDRPNILFLFADDQRADTIRAWGNERIDTPSLDRLAEEGFSFRRNYTFGSNSGAVCVPSRAMVLTGRSWMRSPNDMQGVPTLPRQLEAAGYRTFITGKWHNGEEALLRSFDRGTAVYLGGMADHTQVEVQDIEDGELVRRRVGQAFSSELFADAVIAFLGEQAALAQGDEGDRPFFAYVPFMAPHDPRQPPPEHRERYYLRDLPLPANYMRSTRSTTAS